MHSLPWGELLDVARGAAQAAGALLLEGYRSRPAATHKRPHDLVTEFDLRSEALIRERLGAATPDIALVAEEGGGQSGASTWYCDPLDGTTNFVHGHPFWGVSIGLMSELRPVVGVVVAPALGIEWWGTPDGSFRDGRACRVSPTSQLDESLVATGFPPDRSTAPDNNLDAFGRVLRVVRGIRRCGSAAIDCCLVADGTYDAYWERRLNPWDLVGGCAIALGAGAHLTDLRGGRPDLTVGHLLLSNGALHAALLPLVDGAP